MPRKPRIDYPGAWHHVMNRGAHKQPIFAKHDDAIELLTCIGDAVERYAIEVHGYALLNNHYHLLVRSRHGNLSRAMRWVGGNYTRIINSRYDWDGPIFRGRFHSQLITDEIYLATVMTYIHLNPVRAGLCETPEAFDESSCRAYFGEAQAPRWLTTDVLTEDFGGPAAIRSHTMEILGEDKPWRDGFDAQSGKILDGYMPAPPNMPVAAAQPIFHGGAEALNMIAAYVGCEVSDLQVGSRGRGANAARRFAVWAFTRSTDLTQSAIGGYLGMTPAQVAVALHRFRRSDAPRSAQMREWIDGWPPA